ncbi:MAG: glutamate 5-kinase [Oceanospirillales bacterium TMED33]|nr:glutamate 5-kinase [Gammaproteobacteria bacterium]RPG20038.1 MAG: glutamate 5-kinase [Oceanospirillales bacterium TMED33]
MTERTKLKSSKRWVVKIGSALLTNDGQGLDISRMQTWVKEMSTLIDDGVDLCLVSSGAIAVGLRTLQIDRRPQELPKLQAVAAVGQMGLVQAWQSCFAACGRETAQVLLTHEELADRKRYLNARDTLKTLSQFGVIPVVNENDTIATDEIRFGDNDSLGALATNLLEADVLVILTDQDGFFDKDPRVHPEAALIPEARALDDGLLGMAGKEGGMLGRGGMYTKIMAAQQAARSGAMTVIANGRVDGVLEQLRAGDLVGSLLYPDLKPQAARKRWLASHKQTRGVLVVDAGAAEALKAKGRSLLPVGVIEVRGVFDRGDIVAIETSNGERLATGLVNYGSTQAEEMFGKTTKQLNHSQLLMEGNALVHRDNMALV